MHQTTITATEGVPCFAVEHTEETRKHPSDIIGISIRDAITNKVMWDVGFINASVRMAADECIPYGFSPKGARVNQAPRALVEHEVYSVGMRSDLVLPDDFKHRMSDGRFCFEVYGTVDIVVYDLGAGALKCADRLDNSVLP